ncbi:MAG TPA: hypothetical protein ENK02_11705 [Planctomycetes bacterium]|nr:hypothetical protein [Planctomycetota bacterium]
MRIQHKTRNIQKTDLLAVAELFGIRRPERFIDALASDLAGWNETAKELGVSGEVRHHIQEGLDAKLAEVKTFNPPDG